MPIGGRMSACPGAQQSAEQPGSKTSLTSWALSILLSPSFPQVGHAKDGDGMIALVNITRQIKYTIYLVNTTNAQGSGKLQAVAGAALLAAGFFRGPLFTPASERFLRGRFVT